MTFNEVEPNENLDLRRFQSLPEGRWEFGMIKMGFGKARVRAALAQSSGYVPVDYWGGSYDIATQLLGLIMSLCLFVPESITEAGLVALLPDQLDKELGPDFFERLFKARDEVIAKYGEGGRATRS